MAVIPYLEPSGNYNSGINGIMNLAVIPYLEPSGNYNAIRAIEMEMNSYTIPRTIRELQQNTH